MALHQAGIIGGAQLIHVLGQVGFHEHILILLKHIEHRRVTYLTATSVDVAEAIQCGLREHGKVRWAERVVKRAIHCSLPRALGQIGDIVLLDPVGCGEPTLDLGDEVALGVAVQPHAPRGVDCGSSVVGELVDDCGRAVDNHVNTLPELHRAGQQIVFL